TIFLSVALGVAEACGAKLRERYRVMSAGYLLKSAANPLPGPLPRNAIACGQGCAKTFRNLPAI
ncbi:MAG TPA: hypothetical protein PKL26_02135, partial [Methanolinea sp.]|nr:hypothetical protein [Methanolinea sp.]